MLYAVLFCATSFPALFRKSYFTEYFASKTTPEAVRGTDIYRTINRNMSLAWSLLFALSAFVTVIPALASLPPGPITAMLFQMGLPMLIIMGRGITFKHEVSRVLSEKAGDYPRHAGRKGGAHLKRP